MPAMRDIWSPPGGPGLRRPIAFRGTALMIVTLFLSSCTPAALTALSLGGSAGIQHTINGVSYRTFTASMPEVRAAAQTALDRMGVTNIDLSKTEEGEIISGKAGDRNVEVELITITPNATRMRTTVRNGMLMDSATGTEIILQTERSLAANGTNAGQAQADFVMKMANRDAVAGAHRVPLRREHLDEMIAYHLDERSVWTSPIVPDLPMGPSTRKYFNYSAGNSCR